MTLFARSALLGLTPLLLCASDLIARPQVVDPEVSKASPVDFALDVLPVLSDKCFVCHGPDTPADIDLRLDSEDGATEDRGGYRAIDQEHPEQSEVLIRIDSSDDPMPPHDAEKQLSESEKQLLRQWIEQGGHYEQHWAFVPPRKTAPQDPAANHAGQIIDAFVQQRLEPMGVTLADPAEKQVLARRAALVLTGLPPDPSTLEAFLTDQAPDAYARYVDQLLESPSYGEHQARYWLDAVRYGDTHGLHLDNRRGIYPYRDWVVRALNRNLPLDQFITWQLAGDLLPEPTLEQRIATGYVRLNPTTSEGGAIPDEFQVKNNFDRTETLGTVLLGMTLTCARCHTHKYDPITQTEYYQLLAFFNSTAEGPLDGNAYAFGPTVLAPKDQAAWAAWEELVAQRTELLQHATEIVPPDRIEAFAQQAVAWKSDKWLMGPKTALPSERPGEQREDWQPLTEFPGSFEAVAESDEAGSEEADSKTAAMWIVGSLRVEVGQTLHLTAQGGKVTRILIDGKEASFDDGRVGISKGNHELALLFVLEGNEPSRSVSLSTPWQAVTNPGGWEALSPDERVHLIADDGGPFSASKVSETAKKLAHHLATAQANFTTTLVAEDLANQRTTRVLRRGEYDLPIGDPLSADVPAIMGRLPDDSKRNRLDLARWLTSPEHPLVARVLVNRLWQRVFGDGLVRTPEDFGVQGSRPTHPELLDWLAVELHESGWDMKHMLRLMVTSQTFQQSSARRTDIDDPENKWLARGPRYRLDAEVLRDVGLWASELLDPAMGGEGVKPYQPAGMWLAMAHPGSNTKQYVRDQGKRLYRRSLYVYWKRTSPHPMMTLFDAPDRESSCVRRSRTSTPLQSLGLLNETQRVEMARRLAERLMTEAESDDQRLDVLFQLLASRSPTPRERQACEQLLTSMNQRYKNSPEDAIALLSTGESPRDETLPAPEVAAWSQVCITVLASDVAIMLY